MVQLYQQKKEFEKSGVKIIAVSFETNESVENYLKDTNLEWPVLRDEQKHLYHYFGMRDASFWDIWGYRTWLAYCKEIIRGRRPRKGDGNVNQRGGNILIDPEGLIRLHHIGKGPGDRPEVDFLLRFIREASTDIE